MKEADILKALDRSEALLKDADGKMFMVSADTATVEGLDAIREDLGDAQHSVNNARQILAGLKVILGQPGSEGRAMDVIADVIACNKCNNCGEHFNALRNIRYPIPDPHSLPSESVEPREPDLLGHDYREDIKR